jgi:hypothetical protein
MNEMTRRTFFFLGLGIMKGKVLYEMMGPNIIIPELPVLNIIPYHGLNMNRMGWNQPYLEYYRILAKNEIWDQDYKLLDYFK